MAKERETWKTLLGLGVIGGLGWVISEWAKGRARDEITGAAKTTAKSKLKERIQGALT